MSDAVTSAPPAPVLCKDCNLPVVAQSRHGVRHLASGLDSCAEVQSSKSSIFLKDRQLKNIDSKGVWGLVLALAVVPAVMAIASLGVGVISELSDGPIEGDTITFHYDADDPSFYETTYFKDSGYRFNPDPTTEHPIED